MNRSDIASILADIDDTMSHVRDLSASPGRAAALQCLADARRHLAGATRTITLDDCVSLSTRTIFDSVPPIATDNQPVRNRANEAFRESRRILKGVLK
jgi:hypothetical protein